MSQLFDLFGINIVETGVNEYRALLTTEQCITFERKAMGDMRTYLKEQLLAAEMRASSFYKKPSISNKNAVSYSNNTICYTGNFEVFKIFLYYIFNYKTNTTY